MKWGLAGCLTEPVENEPIFSLGMYMNFLNVILEIASTHTKGTFVAIEYDKLFRKHCEHATAVGATDFDLAKAMHTIHKDSLEKAIANVAKAAKDEKAGDPAGSKKEKKVDL